MGIYTKTGDKGNTSLFGGSRISKSSLIIEALGSVDELNAFLGIIVNNLKNSEKTHLLINIQNDLFSLGANIANPNVTETSKNILDKEITHLEELIDEYDKDLNKLTNFILPGGAQTAAKFHFARTICRRAERNVVKLNKTSKNKNNANIMYLNRLSDLLFILARHENYKEKIKETIWKQ